MRRLTILKEALWVASALGAAAIVARLAGGLGATTDLSDSMPWGLWKIFNMVAGVALATGGFTLAATVYVLRLKKYQPLLKPAILIAFLGYGCSCFALMLDIGLPYAFWKPIVFWNDHSFLFEVAWCVTLYFTIASIEVVPIVLDGIGLGRWGGLIHRWILPVAIVGITLSSLHHSSLGSLFLVMRERLHDLWYTPWLPLLFILSAIGAGLQTVILASLGYSYFYRRPIEKNIVSGLARASAVVLALYLVAKVADLAIRGKTADVFSGQWESELFVAELLLGAVVPVVLGLLPSLLKNTVSLTVGAICAVMGLVLNRLDVGIFGLLRTSDASYVPTLTELFLSVGVVAMAGLVFLYMTEYFPIFEKTPARELLAADADPRQFDHLGRAWALSLMTGRARVSLVVILALTAGVGLLSGGPLKGIALERSVVGPPRAGDAMRASLILEGSGNSGAVFFPHKSLQERLGGEASCVKCHHLSLPGDKATACYQCHTDMLQPTSIFDHDRHVARLGDKWSCEQCHPEQGAKSAQNAKTCRECHEKDMGMPASRPGRPASLAPSYKDAMHGQCLACHLELDRKANQRRMGECVFCHKDQGTGHGEMPPALTPTERRTQP